MAPPTFKFTTDSFPTEFIVVHFKGEEKMSHLFEYRIDLKAVKSIDVDEALMIDELASFTFVSNIATTQDVVIKGIISSFEYLSTGANHHNYRATLVPECWKESLGIDYEIFLGMTPKEIVDEEILDANIDAVTSGVSIAHKERKFTCQYNESNFAFISRIAEHYGMYYYFDHGTDSKVIFTDHKHYPVSDSPQIDFDASAAGNSFFSRISQFKKNTNRTVAQVIVTGSNPDQPSAEIIGKAGDTSASTGNTLRLVEEDVSDSDEAQKIADIRFEEIQATAIVFNGKSGAIQLRPGFTFDLSGHPKDGSSGGIDFNDSYLVTSIIHEGKNVDRTYSGNRKSFYYRNSFKAINSAVQFRPGKITPKPHAISTVGKVYSEVGDPRQAERNEKGEYRVRFNFLDDETYAKASSWLRMATPAAGTKDTIDIPLKGGVEVHISFENGNPDKPFIQNALPNAQFPSQVTDNNLNHALIGTDGLLALKSSGGFHLNVKTEQDTVRDSAGDFYFPKLNATTNALENPMTIEQEMSGDYLVERAYGEEYEYRDGSSFRYLNNESEYVIGTGYLEQHVNDASDTLITYRNIGSTTLGKWEVPDAFKTIVDPNDATNKSVPGLVEKTWGDEYDYHNGTAYSWSECSKSPNLGGRSINFGTGYTLNFFDATAEQTESSFAHLTDEDHEDLTGISGFAQDLNQGLAQLFSPTASTKINEAFTNGEASNNNMYHDITKTTGKTYDYHKGDELNIHIGETIDIVYGGTTIFTQGDSFEHFNGDSQWYFNGGHDDFHMGRTTTTHLGYKLDNFVGISEELHLGPCIDFTSAGKKVFHALGKKICGSKKEEVTADENKAALKVKETALVKKVDALKYTINSLDVMIITTGRIGLASPAMIAFKTPTFNVNGVLIKLG